MTLFFLAEGGHVLDFGSFPVALAMLVVLGSDEYLGIVHGTLDFLSHPASVSKVKTCCSELPPRQKAMISCFPPSLVEGGLSFGVAKTGLAKLIT